MSELVNAYLNARRGSRAYTPREDNPDTGYGPPAPAIEPTVPRVRPTTPNGARGTPARSPGRVLTAAGRREESRRASAPLNAALGVIPGVVGIAEAVPRLARQAVTTPLGEASTRAIEEARAARHERPLPSLGEIPVVAQRPTLARRARALGEDVVSAGKGAAAFARTLPQAVPQLAYDVAVAPAIDAATQLEEAGNSWREGDWRRAKQSGVVGVGNAAMTALNAEGLGGLGKSVLRDLGEIGIRRADQALALRTVRGSQPVAPSMRAAAVERDMRQAGALNNPVNEAASIGHRPADWRDQFARRNEAADAAAGTARMTPQRGYMLDARNHANFDTLTDGAGNPVIDPDTGVPISVRYGEGRDLPVYARQGIDEDVANAAAGKPIEGANYNNGARTRFEPDNAPAPRAPRDPSFPANDVRSGSRAPAPPLPRTAPERAGNASMDRRLPRVEIFGGRRQWRVSESPREAILRYTHDGDSDLQAALRGQKSPISRETAEREAAILQEGLDASPRAEGRLIRTVKPWPELSAAKPGDTLEFPGITSFWIAPTQREASDALRFWEAGTRAADGKSTNTLLVLETPKNAARVTGTKAIEATYGHRARFVVDRIENRFGHTEGRRVVYLREVDVGPGGSRSVHAAFDPAKRNSSDLLAAAPIALGAAGAAMVGPDDAEAKGSMRNREPGGARNTLAIAASGKRDSTQYGWGEMGELPPAIGRGGFKERLADGEVRLSDGRRGWVQYWQPEDNKAPPVMIVRVQDPETGNITNVGTLPNHPRLNTTDYGRGPTRAGDMSNVYGGQPPRGLPQGPPVSMMGLAGGALGFALLRGKGAGGLMRDLAAAETVPPKLTRANMAAWSQRMEQAREAVARHRAVTGALGAAGGAATGVALDPGLTPQQKVDLAGVYAGGAGFAALPASAGISAAMREGSPVALGDLYRRPPPVGPTPAQRARLKLENRPASAMHPRTMRRNDPLLETEQVRLPEAGDPAPTPASARRVVLPQEVRDRVRSRQSSVEHVPKVTFPYQPPTRGQLPPPITPTRTVAGKTLEERVAAGRSVGPHIKATAKAGGYSSDEVAKAVETIGGTPGRTRAQNARIFADTFKRASPAERERMVRALKGAGLLSAILSLGVYGTEEGRSP